MRTKTILASGVLALSLAALGSAKSWDVQMDAPTKAGAVTIPTGTYYLKLSNNQAVFKNTDSGKEITVPVQVLQKKADKKFDHTAVETQKANDGSNVIQTIDLGGTTEELQFGE